jgi:hypothetical protein
MDLEKRYSKRVLSSTLRYSFRVPLPQIHSHHAFTYRVTCRISAILLKGSKMFTSTPNPVNFMIKTLKSPALVLRLRGGANNEEISQRSTENIPSQSLDFHTMTIRGLDVQSIHHNTNMMMRRNALIYYVTSLHIDVLCLSEIGYPTAHQLMSSNLTLSP